MGSYINLSSPLLTALHAGIVSECMKVVGECVELMTWDIWTAFFFSDFHSLHLLLDEL